MGAAIQTSPRKGGTLTIDYFHQGDLVADVIDVVESGAVIGDVKARFLRIHGRVDGNIEAEQVTIDRKEVPETVIAGRKVPGYVISGWVRGNVTAQILKAAGRVDGDIQGDEVLIGKNAHVRGTVRYRTLGISPGAVVAFASIHPLPSVVITDEEAPAEQRTAPPAPVRHVREPVERRQVKLPSLIG
jgi:cytoskeletal protein CcmA (bactofilin family)